MCRKGVESFIDTYWPNPKNFVPIPSVKMDLMAHKEYPTLASLS